MQSKCHVPDSRPIAYHCRLHLSFDGWAADCACEPNQLRSITEAGIRKHHAKALISHQLHLAFGNQPNIWQLNLGPVWALFSIESHAVVVRGYGWEIEGESADDFDGGGFFGESDW